MTGFRCERDMMLHKAQPLQLGTITFHYAALVSQLHLDEESVAIILDKFVPDPDEERKSQHSPEPHIRKQPGRTKKTMRRSRGHMTRLPLEMCFSEPLLCRFRRSCLRCLTAFCGQQNF